VLTRAAYDAAGAVWGSGPQSVYDELARPLVAAAGDLRGRRCLDVGTGAGAVAGQLRQHGADVVAADQSLGMLRPHAATRPPAVVCDVAALPFSAGAFDLVTAGFVLNHVDDAVGGLRELARVGRTLVATTFGGEAGVEVKEALQAVLEQHGFSSPSWYSELQHCPLHRPTVGQARAVLGAAGLRSVEVVQHDVVVSLTADQAMAWRWGMAQTAAFVGGLAPDERAALEVAGREALGDVGPVAFPVLVMVGQSS